MNSFVSKESSSGNKNPLFLRVLNREVSGSDIVRIFSGSDDIRTADIARRAIGKIIDLDEFREELEGAIRDVVKTGVGEEFKAFVDHYMQESLEEEQKTFKGALGENRSQVARIKNEEAPWPQGLVCYNLCLYIKAFGLEELKICKVCGKIFCHKGKYAVYCSAECKAKKIPDATGRKLEV